MMLKDKVQSSKFNVQRILFNGVSPKTQLQVYPLKRIIS